MTNTFSKNQNNRRKKTAFFFLLALPLFIIQSCGLLEEWDLNEYDGDLSWEKVTEKAEWDNRLDHEVTILNDEIYLTGGYNPGKVSGDPYYEDVWKSSNGIDWTNLTNNAPWLGRRGHAFVTFNDGGGDALYIIGGFSVNEETGERAYNNDVWKSTDGESWTEIKDSTEWTARMHHKCVVTNHGGQDYIYLIGGYTMTTDSDGRYGIKYLDDVWRSTNGIDWVNLNNTDFGIRAEHAVTVSDDGTIYMQGGQHGIIFEAAVSSGGKPVRGYSNLWQSADGENWTNSEDALIGSASFLGRAGHEVIFYKDRIWSLPGKSTSLNHYSFGDPQHYGTWTLDVVNGVWGIDSRGTAIDARHNYAAIVWKDKIWVMGGITSGKGQDNDVWSASL